MAKKNIEIDRYKPRKVVDAVVVHDEKGHSKIYCPECGKRIDSEIWDYDCASSGYLWFIRCCKQCDIGAKYYCSIALDGTTYSGDELRKLLNLYKKPKISPFKKVEKEKPTTNKFTKITSSKETIIYKKPKTSPFKKVEKEKIDVAKVRPKVPFKKVINVAAPKKSSPKIPKRKFSVEIQL